MSKIAKNTTGSDIEIVAWGITIPSNGQVSLNTSDFGLVASTSSLLEIAPYLQSGDIVLNNGISDLSAEDGLALLQGNLAELQSSLISNDRIKIDVTGTLSDAKVQVSSNDATSGYLEEKIIAENNKVSVTTINDGADEDLQIGINPSNIGTSELNNDANFIDEAAHDSLPQDNPHNVTKTQVGLGNVDNTSDVDKPVSTAQQTALDLKYNASNPNGYETPAELDARDIANRSRGNHTGTQLASTISDFTSAVQASETDTTIQLIGNTLRYIGEDGTNQDIDLSLYLDDTNLARLVSGTLDSQTGIVTFTRDDASTFTVDFSSLLTTSVDLQNEIYVAKNGNDSTGDGTIASPFLTISQAITYINTQTPSVSNQFCIKVSPGSYSETNLILPEYVSLYGQPFRTEITASAQTAHLLSASINSMIKDIKLSGLTSSSYFHLNLESTSAGLVLINNLLVLGGANGINITSTVAGYQPLLNSITCSQQSDTSIQLGANSFTEMSTLNIQGNGTTTTGVKTTSNSTCEILIGTISSCDIGIDQQSTGKSVINGLDLLSSTIPFKKLNSSELEFKGVSAVGENALVAEISGLKGYFLDNVQGDQKLRLFDELSVGVPGQGKEAAIGEGDSYTNGMKVYTTTNLSTFIDVTTEASSIESSTFAMPGTGVNNAIYISSQRLQSGTSNPVLWEGLKINCTTASVGGEIVAEYWNGSSWIEFNHMSTESFGKYLPKGKAVFERTGSEHIRFNPQINSSWTVNDPVSLGTSYYWMRFRVVSSLTTAPSFEQFKIHTNRTEINPDGYMEYFGQGRTLNILPFDYGSLQPANSSPADQDLWIGDSMGFGGDENQFNAFSTNRIGLVRPLPVDLDTSHPVRMVVHLHSELTDTSPDIDWTLRFSRTNVGSSVYDSTGSAPSTAVGQQTLTTSVTNPGQDQQFKIEFELDVSDFVTRDADNIGDLLWISLQRDNDGNASDISVIQIELQYLKWCNGGHL